MMKYADKKFRAMNIAQGKKSKGLEILGIKASL